MSTNNFPLFADYPDLCTFKEMCQMLRIGKTKGLELIKDGTISSRLVNNHRLIPKNAIIRYYIKQPKRGYFSPLPPMTDFPIYNILHQPEEGRP